MGGVGEPLVYRPTLSRVLAVLYVVIALWFLWADLAARGAGRALTLVPVLLAVGAAVYALLWRPCVRIDAGGVVLCNVLRDVRVPWAALEEVDTRYTLTLHTAAGAYQSWAAPAPGRPSPVPRGWTQSAAGRTAGGPAGDEGARLPDARWQPGGVAPDRSSRALGADSGAAAFMVEQGWARWREGRAAAAPGTPAAGDGAVRVSWDRPLLAVLTASTVAAVLVAVLAG